MADLDTRSKRASSVQILSACVLTPVLPDGTINQADRQHIVFSYSGILAASPMAEPQTEPRLRVRRAPTPQRRHNRSV